LHFSFIRLFYSNIRNTSFSFLFLFSQKRHRPL
jgi:hypothetical protein